MSKPTPPFAYGYSINLDERGDFMANVRDLDGNTVFSIDSASDLLELIEGGFMKRKEDWDGLGRHLIEVGVIPKGAKVYSSAQYEIVCALIESVQRQWKNCVDMTIDNQSLLFGLSEANQKRLVSFLSGKSSIEEYGEHEDEILQGLSVGELGFCQLADDLFCFTNDYEEYLNLPGMEEHGDSAWKPLTSDAAYEQWRQVAERYASFGADDTEGRSAMASIQQAAQEGRPYPEEDNLFEIYSSPDSQASVKEVDSRLNEAGRQYYQVCKLEMLDPDAPQRQAKRAHPVSLSAKELSQALEEHIQAMEELIGASMESKGDKSEDCQKMLLLNEIMGVSHAVSGISDEDMKRQVVVSSPNSTPPEPGL